MFHMEHCVFCTFLSNGTSYKNCGRPCERHHVQLRDRVGQLHPLLADAVPLTLEEIFIYELGGADYAVKDIVL